MNVVKRLVIFEGLTIQNIIRFRLFRAKSKTIASAPIQRCSFYIDILA